MTDDWETVGGKKKRGGTKAQGAKGSKWQGGAKGPAKGHHTQNKARKDTTRASKKPMVKPSDNYSTERIAKAISMITASKSPVVSPVVSQTPLHEEKPTTDVLEPIWESLSGDWYDPCDDDSYSSVHTTSNLSTPMHPKLNNSIDLHWQPLQYATQPISPVFEPQQKETAHAVEESTDIATDPTQLTKICLMEKEWCEKFSNWGVLFDGNYAFTNTTGKYVIVNQHMPVYADVKKMMYGLDIFGFKCDTTCYCVRRMLLSNDFMIQRYDHFGAN